MGAIRQAVTKDVGDLEFMEVLHALADPIRLEIVRKLDEAGEKACGTFDFDMPKSSLSHHFGILRKSGVITSESQGAKLMNRLQRKRLDASFPGVLDSLLAAAYREQQEISDVGLVGQRPRRSAIAKIAESTAR